MRNLEASSHRERWLDRPLCSRYATVVFSAVRHKLISQTSGAQHLCWALGCLANGEAEVLGIWKVDAAASAATAPMLDELHERGAEFLRFAIGDLAEAQLEFQRIYGTGELLVSIEQSLEQVARLVPPRHRADVADCLRLAAEAQSLEAGRSELARFQVTALGKRYPEVVRRWDEALARFQPVYSLNHQLRGLVRSADRAAAKMRGGLAHAIHRHGPFIDSENAFEFIAATLRSFELRLDRDRAAARAAREVRATSRSSAATAAVAVPALT